MQQELVIKNAAPIIGSINWAVNIQAANPKPPPKPPHERPIKNEGIHNKIINWVSNSCIIRTIKIPKLGI